MECCKEECSVKYVSIRFFREPVLSYLHTLDKENHIPKKGQKKSDLKRATVRESKTGCLQFYYTVCFRKCRPYRIYETIGTLHDVITDLF